MKTKQGLAYMVAAETATVPNRVVCVTVALDKIIIGMDDRIRVDLADHPLYHHLQAYVLANPRPAPPKKGKS